MILLKFLLYASLMAFVPIIGFSQIEFANTYHDFGTFPEGENKQYTFTFKNTGKKPITLKKVQASCGCTTPSWTTEEVKPGQSGKVEVIYNSFNRPGPFTKNVTVIYDTTQSPLILTIRGHVTPKDESKGGSSTLPPGYSNQINYVDTIGAIALERQNEPLGDFKSDETRDVLFFMKNISKQTVKITSLENAHPNCFEVTLKERELKPGAEVAMAVKVIGKNFDACGFKNGDEFENPIDIFTDQTTNNAFVLVLNGVYHRKFTQEELKTVPKIVFEKTEFDGGEILEGEKLNVTFKFKNEGKADLKIESAKASCGCTASAPKEKLIPPGSSSAIIGSFDSTGRPGLNTKTITVISNDPNTPSVRLTLKVNVKPDPFKEGGPMSSPLSD